MKIFLRIIHLIIMVVCIILQLTFVEHLRIFGISMDLVAVLIIGIAIFDDVISAMFYGFFAGLLLDLMTSSVIGVSALIYALNGFIAGSVIRLWDRQRIINYLLVVFFITEINLLLVSGIYYLFNYDISFRELALELIVNPVFNIIAMFLIFPLLSAGKYRKEEIGFIYKDKI